MGLLRAKIGCNFADSIKYRTLLANSTETNQNRERLPRLHLFGPTVDPIPHEKYPILLGAKTLLEKQRRAC
jgi:hypothetical protein